MMHPVHQRLAELSITHRKRKLTFAEECEFNHCLRANEKLVYEAALLFNMSYLAHTTDDHEWQHEICAKVEKL